MNLVGSPSVQAAMAAAPQDATGSAAQLLMLKKAMNLEASGAAALIEALPKAPALATSGSLGRNVDTYA